MMKRLKTMTLVFYYTKKHTGKYILQSRSCARAAHLLCCKSKLHIQTRKTVANCIMAYQLVQVGADSGAKINVQFVGPAVRWTGKENTLFNYETDG